MLCCGIVGSGRYGKHTSSSFSRRHRATSVDDGVSLAEKGTAPPRIETGSWAAHPKIDEGFIFDAGDEGIAGGSAR